MYLSISCVESQKNLLQIKGITEAKLDKVLEAINKEKVRYLASVAIPAVSAILN